MISVRIKMIENRAALSVGNALSDAPVCITIWLSMSSEQSKQIQLPASVYTQDRYIRRNQVIVVVRGKRIVMHSAEIAERRLFRSIILEHRAIVAVSGGKRN